MLVPEFVVLDMLVDVVVVEVMLVYVLLDELVDAVVTVEVVLPPHMLIGKTRAMLRVAIISPIVTKTCTVPIDAQLCYELVP